jgi:integrase
MPLGLFGTVSLSTARKTAKIRAGEIAGGRDPQAEQKENIRREEARLDRALDAYAGSLNHRKVVNRATILSTLRRGLLSTLGKLDLANIDRQTIAKQIARLEAAGMAGAAQDLRAKATTFLNWAVGQGFIYANPLAGWHRERATRAQITGRSGRALSGAEIRSLWVACEDAPAPFGDYVRLLILTGQRRGETAEMRWQDINLGDGVWTIPRGVTKNGREHRVPLPRFTIDILTRQRRLLDSPYVFAGRGGAAMSGWSKRMRSLASAGVADFTLHDLRRTFRSGLSQLGVDADIAELMLNHARADLVERYDREPRWAERVSAAQGWADRVAGLVGRQTTVAM